MKKCIIIGAGDFTTPREINGGDLIIAADGGYDHAAAAGIIPNLFVGDMDSLATSLPDSIEKITFPERKDFTDMQLAYTEGARRGYENFELYGGTGGRSDHTFANISLLLKIARDGCRAKIISEREIYRVIENESICLSGECGKYISIFALGGEARGVNLSGLDYEAESLTLTPDFPLGVSNKFTEREAKISVRDGALLIIEQI